MAGKAITEQPEERTRNGWQPTGEVAPSLLREDEPTLARALGLLGAVLVIFGGMALWFNLASSQPRVIGPGQAAFLMSLGLVGLLLHASFDRDVQYRRMYMIFGYLCLITGVFLCLLPYPAAGANFRYGFFCLVLALVFLLAFLRNETEQTFRNAAELVLGGAGAVMAAVSLFGGNLRSEFLLPIGLVLAVLGLVYLTAFVCMRGVGDDLAYRVGLAIGALGLVVFLVALGRSALPVWFRSLGWNPNYFLPQGLLLMGVGLLYGLLCLGLCSDRTVVVLTRRELAALFYSPLAYFLLLGFGLASWVQFFFFMGEVVPPTGEHGLLEPIVQRYLFGFFPVLINLFAVPVLTMRLMSEERRTGTLEVLLTAPVEETEVVLSKFLAAFLMYLLLWVPAGLYLLVIPVNGGAPFDYQPLLSSLVGLATAGAGFVSVGLFFSSLTRNQIISGVLTFACMLILTLPYFLVHWFNTPPGWKLVWTHVSYLDLWGQTAQGRLIPKNLLFFASMTVWWLFATVKVLEARKWL